MDEALCKCGCGQMAQLKDTRGRLRSGYVQGHNRRGVSNTWKIKPDAEIRKRQHHERAAKKKRGVTACEWTHIGYCSGLLEVAHINGDYSDGRQANLLKLCRTHHRLLDHGRIDPASPVMPAFVVRGGKRRYG